MENEVKEPAPKYNYVSPEEYLEMERISKEKHEYYKGEIYVMAGATWEHNVIVKNINTAVLPFLKDNPCDLFGSDLRIHVPENSLYTYPDFSIICGQPHTTANEKDTVILPSAIIEVVSKSTRDYDRGMKFHLYRNISTLQEYILVDSTEVCVEVYARQPDARWILSEYKLLSDSFTIKTIDFVLGLDAIYEGLHFKE